MAFKLLQATQQRRWAVNAPHLVTLAHPGTHFERGKLAERDTTHEATTDTASPPASEEPTTSDQPVNNAT
jgi:hypothetical protein